jgi:hypothetical protein
LAQSPRDANQIRDLLRRHVQRTHARDDEIHRAAQFCARLPGRIQPYQRRRRSAEVTIVFAQHRLDAPHRVGRRIVGDEVAYKLGGDEAVGRRMVGEESRRRDPVSFIGRERLLHHRLDARLMGEQQFSL